MRTWVFYWDRMLREDLACALDESMRDAHAIRVGHVPAAVDDEGGSAAGLNLDAACGKKGWRRGRGRRRERYLSLVHDRWTRPIASG